MRLSFALATSFIATVVSLVSPAVALGSRVGSSAFGEPLPCSAPGLGVRLRMEIEWSPPPDRKISSIKVRFGLLHTAQSREHTLHVEPNVELTLRLPTESADGTIDAETLLSHFRELQRVTERDRLRQTALPASERRVPDAFTRFGFGAARLIRSVQGRQQTTATDLTIEPPLFRLSPVLSEPTLAQEQVDGLSTALGNINRILGGGNKDLERIFISCLDDAVKRRMSESSRTIRQFTNAPFCSREG